MFLIYVGIICLIIGFLFAMVSDRFYNDKFKTLFKVLSIISFIIFGVIAILFILGFILLFAMFGAFGFGIL